jgi:hypothetical protein
VCQGKKGRREAKINEKQKFTNIKGKGDEK